MELHQQGYVFVNAVGEFAKIQKSARLYPPHQILWVKEVDKASLFTTPDGEGCSLNIRTRHKLMGAGEPVKATEYRKIDIDNWGEQCP